MVVYSDPAIDMSQSNHLRRREGGAGGGMGGEGGKGGRGGGGGAPQAVEKSARRYKP